MNMARGRLRKHHSSSDMKFNPNDSDHYSRIEFRAFQSMATYKDPNTMDYLVSILCFLFLYYLSLKTMLV